MNEVTRSRPITVRVLIYLTASGQYCVGIITSEWQGAVRVDRRLARLRPADAPVWYPPGVDHDVYRAYQALGSLIDELRTDGLLREP
jgi:hypothetical protein